jgi:hypothetical protein
VEKICELKKGNFCEIFCDAFELKEFPGRHSGSLEQKLTMEYSNIFALLSAKFYFQTR